MSDLGTATGRIVLDTAGVRSAQREVQTASQQMSDSLRQIGASVGVAFGTREIIKFAVEADAVATSFRRQQVAALQLAGSQAQLNDLLRTYQTVTRGAVDDATALADVTNLITQGFADNTKELDTFLRGVRGAAAATGKSQEFIITRLQLELLNQTGQRLNELGLNMELVRARAKSLADANRGLSREQVYQNAVMDELLDKFGKLADSDVLDPTGVENLTKAWKQFRLEFGKQTGGTTGFLSDALANWLNDNTKAMQAFGDVTLFVAQALGLADRNLNSWDDVQLPSGISDRTRGNAARGGFGAVPFTGDQTAAIVQWAQDVARIERQANRDRISATQQFEQQRSQIIRDYGKTLVREAQDFAISRARAEQDFQRNATRIQADTLRNEERQAADLGKGIGRARADSEERIADARKASAKRLADIESDYQRDRIRRAEAFSDSLIDAAGRLDAKAVAEAQRNYKRQERDAKENYDDQRAKLKEQLQERLDNEAESLAKSITQQNEAYAQQLADAREAAARQTEDAKAEFELRKAREDEDRVLRQQRAAEDNADQLAELERGHAERLAEIARNETETKQELNQSLNARLESLGIHNEKWLAEQKRWEAQALKDFAEFTAQWRQIMAGTPQGPATLNPFITPGSFPSINPGGTNGPQRGAVSATINIYPTPNQSPYDIATAVRTEVIKIYREVAE